MRYSSGKMVDYEISGGESTLRIVESTHDTFDPAKFSNWLVNAAGVGIYMHGRVHQQSGNLVFISDLIHKRGHLATDDLLLMEEQALDSCGEPLSARSSFGPLLAMEILPEMNTGNGEGDLIAYYRNGVAAFNTAAAPRETRLDGDGKVIQKGWDTLRQVSHLLNKISATGRYAVAVLPRDHFFRSTFGLHFLKVALGEGSFATEQINKLSMDVEPVLNRDDADLLSGVACGFWLHGNRMFATTGMSDEPGVSASPVGRGFVSWNQAITFTEDRTPVPAWEGLWLPDAGIAGIHWFGDVSAIPGVFGFLASDTELGLHFVEIDPTGEDDSRGGEDIPVEWSFESARVHGGLDQESTLKEGSMDVILRKSTRKIRVLVRTDRTGWMPWHEFGAGDQVAGRRESYLVTESFGKPPQPCVEGTWFQVRVEGLGAAEVRGIDLDISTGVAKTGKRKRTLVETTPEDYFATQSSPASTRW